MLAAVLTLLALKQGSATVQVEPFPLATPKVCPVQVGDAKPQFSTQITCRVDGVIRFRVFAQEKPEVGHAMATARFLLRLYELSSGALRLRLSPDSGGKVDVYLCQGGPSGGEQRLAGDFDDDGRPVTANVILVYDVGSLTDKVEWLREVAHEYGHASLPAVGGYREPEDWANGYLGEKLYLKMTQEKLRSGVWPSADLFGVEPAGLDRWVSREVDPLVKEANQVDPKPASLKGNTAKAMRAYHARVLWAYATFPRSIFARSLVLGGTKSTDYFGGLELAFGELERVDVRPAQLGPVWLPLGKGKLTSGKVLTRNGKWAKVQPGPKGIIAIPESPDSATTR
jgi:hypothetical protein